MFFFITGIILILIGAIALVLYKINKNYIDEDDTYTRYNNGCLKIVSLVLVVLGLVVVITQCFYTQDAGDVKVLRDFGGNIAGSSTETGLHLKAPWQDVITYDIRNNVISFVADGEESFDGVQRMVRK